MKKKIVLLGATGSIGKSTIEVVKEHSDKFEIVLAQTHRRYNDLLKYSNQINIPNLAITNSTQKINLHTNKKIYWGEEGLINSIAKIDYDIILNAIVGAAGLKYTIAALRRKNITIALANKESLVMAGKFIMEIARKNNCKIIPVDSEHSAILQCITGLKDPSQIRKIILTASGGPFRTKNLNDFKEITLSDTLNHPTWNMGEKITVDSATMANKGLEVIEAHHLFGVNINNIEVVIHPQSIVHSFVEFKDGSILAQLSNPDMKIPIQFAISYPDHIKATAKYTNISLLPNLEFHQVNYYKFPMLKLAYDVGKEGGILPTVFNAANEAAVTLFLNNKIHFTEIKKIVEKSVQKAEKFKFNLETIFEVDKKIKKDIYSRF